MSISIPEYIEGHLSGQYSGLKEEDHRLIKNRFALLKKAKQYSVTLYKDLHIDNAVIISEQEYDEVKNSEKWWKINHTAEAAIDFLYPFFEHYTFLRHLPIEIYVESPTIKYTDKKEQRNATYGILTGRVRAKLTGSHKMVTQPQKVSSTPVDPTDAHKIVSHTQIVGSASLVPTAPVPETIPVQTDKGCFNRNDSFNGCFGAYGNPAGCFSAPMSSGCFPNIGLGCLMPGLLMFLLLFALLKSCSYFTALTPIVNTIKKDRDNSRTPPPLWVTNPDDTTKPEPDYVPKSDSLLKVDSLKPTIDSFKIVDTIPKINKGTVQLILWDWDVEDKDTVSVFLNNKLIIDKLRLRKKPYLITQNGLKYGENYLEVVAVNTDKGSNTVAIMGYSDRSKLCNTALKLKSSQTMRLTLIYQ